MIDYKSNLLLSRPILFYDICTIYPPTIQEIVDYSDEYYNSLFVPYILTSDALIDELASLSILEVIFQSENLMRILIESLRVFCKTDDIKIDFGKCELFINNNNTSLNVDNFDKFSEIVLFMSYREKYKLEPKVEPKFKTKEGRESWLQLEALRAKQREREEDSFRLANIINVVQMGGGSYISEYLMRKWSYWKLINTYTSILQIDASKSYFNVYLQTGDKKLIEKHWSDLIKI